MKPVRVGVILAGGVGARLGSGPPKAIRPFAGTTLLARAIALLSTRTDRIFAAVPHDFPLPASLGCERIDDLAYMAGPFGSMPALEHAATGRADIAWVVPVDMPFLGGEHLDVLAYALDPPDGPSVQLGVVPPAAVVPRTSRGVEPLIGAYRPVYAAPILRAAWNKGERAPHRALSDLGGRIRFLDVEKDGVWPGGLASLAGTNTLEEWARAEERVQAERAG